MPQALAPVDVARLRDNLERIRARIARACAAAGRAEGSVALVAVTKYSGVPLARALVELGQRDLGENRVQHLGELAAGLADLAPRWHMIGHLQRNKANKAAPLLSAIHSLDSAELARKLDAARPAELPPLDVYLELRLDEKETRSGVTAAELPALWAEVGRCARLRPVGLMGLPPLGEDPRPHFQRVRAAAAELGVRALSMGMTEDLEVAVEEGATVVRVGRALLEGLSAEALA
ncbi:MAG: YggS family pyridoxal phosphate-dependent enzyme [Planctomycetota bacterium]